MTASRSAVLLLLLGLTACGPRPPEGRQPLAAAAPAAGATLERELASTGFVAGGEGAVLTAAHAADDCPLLFVRKDGRTLAAQLVALSPRDDLALLKVEAPLGPPAVFARAGTLARNDLVFAGSYQALHGNRDGGALFNGAVAAVAEDGTVELVSNATHGASGAPVLNASGLVIGVISRRVGANRVLATGAGAAKAFLAANGVAVAEDERPQLGAFQGRASRAATLSVAVLCYKDA